MKRIALGLAVLIGCATERVTQRRDANVVPADQTLKPRDPKGECSSVETLVSMNLDSVPIPSGYTEDQMFTAIVQAIAQLGIKTAMANRDVLAVTTDWVTGQSLSSTCGVVTLRSYEFRYSILGSIVSINAGCRQWFAYQGGPAKQVDCGQLIVTSVTDATIARGIVELAILLMQTRDPHPAPR